MLLLDRNQAILDLCRGKSVLHLGCIGYTDLSKDQRIELLPMTLHAQIYKVADNLIGLDYSKEVIEEIKHVDGFKSIYYANAEKLENLVLQGTFETIVVGDLIEHLSNPGQMLEGLRKFCNSDTIIIITTPNAFGIASMLRYIFNKFKEGKEHVMSFNHINIQQLLIRHGYETLDVNTCYQENVKKMRFFNLLKGILSVYPKFGGTLFLKLRKGKSA